MESARRDVRNIARSLISQLQLLLRAHATAESVHAALPPRLPSFVGVSLHVRLLSFFLFLFSASAPAFLHRRATACEIFHARSALRFHYFPRFPPFISVACHSMMLPLRTSSRPPSASSLMLVCFFSLRVFSHFFVVPGQEEDVQLLVHALCGTNSQKYST